MNEVTFEYRYGVVIGVTGGLLAIKYNDGIIDGVVYRKPSEVELVDK